MTASPLAPFQPDATQPWDFAAAAHLVRRAGFCGSREEIRQALEDGPAQTVDRLLDRTKDSPRHDDLDALGDRLARRNDIEAVRGWWLMRMRYTSRPRHARMAVFWHDHFATSNVKVNDALMMYRHLRTIEQHALGPLETLLQQISRDPAMIVWLDGDDNVKGRPNENYARELFELFTLGVGNYREADIQEAARAFTGWHQARGRFRFVAREHDEGPKCVFGVEGPHDGDDIIRLALEQPACAIFIGRKLLEQFICPHPPDGLTEATAACLRENGYHIGETLRTILKSRAMFDDPWYRARIKSPVEFVIGLARSLGVHASAEELSTAASGMGQRLLEPPTVEGWDDHRGWLNSTMLVRLNAATSVTADAERFDVSALLNRHGFSDHAAILDYCGRITLDGRVPDALRAELSKLEGRGEQLLRRALRLLLSSPEYQLA